MVSGRLPNVPLVLIDGAVLIEQICRAGSFDSSNPFNGALDSTSVFFVY